jgi:alginate O-acetyltransferase complex protein AlgI
MEIISQQFAVFTLATLGVYYLLPRRGQNVWLAACSLYFAASWRWEYAAFLSGSILVNYGLGRKIAGSLKSKKLWLIIGITLNTAGLLLFRFAASGYVDLLFRLLTGGSSLTTQILIPIGFSFYTLQAISYLVDVSQKQIPVEEDLIDFGVYLAYFPHLLSGPIERAKTFLPQLKNERLVKNDMLAEGGWLILSGLFRKLVIASLLFSMIPVGVFQHPHDFAVTDRWIALLVYGFWLYNDFAGYTSLVRGVSLLFGIRLSPNFKQPFFSRTMLEFWNRWHLSLSFWLRDYIFFPIQRNLVRRGYSSNSLARIALPPLVTMLVSGLWHNATLSLLSWGLLQGAYQVMDHLAAGRPGYIPPKNRPGWQQVLLSVRVYLLLLPTWILFASGGLKLAVTFTSALFSGGGILRLRPLGMVAPLAGLLISFLFDHLQEKYGEERAIFQLPRLAQSACVAAMILCIVLSILWSTVPSAAFVYQGF